MSEFDEFDEFEEEAGTRHSPSFDPRVHNGVTANWLAQMFNMDTRTVRKKLAPILPIAKGRGGSDLYHFVKAAAYLVEPKIDLDEYIKTIKPEQLPNKVNKDYWDAKLKEMKFLEEAGELWRTEDVLEVFGETLKHMRGCMNLWVDSVKKNATTTKEQAEVFKNMVDSLQNDIHAMLIERSKIGNTKSYLGEFEDANS